MSKNDLYDLIQGQVFIFTDNIMGGNGVSQVYAVTSRGLAKGEDVDGKAWIVKCAEIDGLVMLFPRVQRQRIFTVTMHQFQQQELKWNVFINGPNIHSGAPGYSFLTTTGRA
jgi:hypothetical protein